MATDLGSLIQWLLNRIASCGEDGVSVSQILASIEAFYSEPNVLARGEVNTAGEGIPSIDHKFKSKVWSLLIAHADVSVGKDKCGNDLDLSEIEALPPAATEEPGGLLNPSSITIDLERTKFADAALEGSELEDHSSPSAQLLELIVHPTSQAVLPNTKSSNSVHAVSEDISVDSSEHLNQSDKVLNSPNVAGNSVKSGSGVEKLVDGLVIHGPINLEIGEPVGHDRSKDRDEQSALASIKIQPRVYITQEGKKMDFNGHGIDSERLPEHESSLNAPKRRGRPPKLKTQKSHSRRGRPPKADLTPLISSASIPQQTTLTEALGSANTLRNELTSEPNIVRGRQSQKNTIFTSYDELQRDAGVAGVYFDLKEFQQSGIGRPRKRKIALFKSEKLKNLPWMRDVTKDTQTAPTLDQPVHPVEATAVDDPQDSLIQQNETISKTRNCEPEDPTSDESQPKRLLANIVRNLGNPHLVPYKSPYSSIPAGFQLTSSTNISTEPCPPSTRAKILAPESERHQVSSPVEPRNIVSSTKSSALKNTVDQLTLSQAAQRIASEQLVTAIRSVGELTIPGVNFQLPCSKNDTVGNLCLSMDRKSLVFITKDKQKVTSPITIQISDIVEQPETSPAGSETMVLRIIESSTNGAEKIHEFMFLSIQPAIFTANSMRAKIVTAMTFLDLEENSDTVQPDKLFTCSRCDGTWKNLEGVKYHQTKSKTSCNPNYIPRTSRRSKANAQGVSLLKDERPVVELDGNRAIESTAQKQPAVQSESSLSSETIKNARSSLEVQRAKDLIMTLLDANGQIFPGQKSLWFACIASSLQKFPNSDLSNYDVFNSALDLLEDSGRVRKLQFSFKDQMGLMKWRTLITGQDIDPTSTEVVSMKENMKSKFPEHYIPLGFEPPKVVQSMLEERQNRVEAMGGSHRYRQAAETPQSYDIAIEKGPEALQMSLNHVPSSTVTRSGRISRRPQSLLDSSLLSSTRNLDEYGDRTDDESYGEDLPRYDLASQQMNIVSDHQRKRKRSRAIKGSLIGSAGIQWSPSPRRTNILRSPKTIEIESLGETDDESAERKHRNYEARLLESSSSSAAIFSPAPAYFQSGNGSWSVSWNVVIQPRVTRKYRPRAGLPEPITYFQTWQSSAWNFRPYGHGVRPIYARPAKRTEVQTAYLSKIRNGFRPVMMPTGEIFIPDTTSESVIGLQLPTRQIRRKRKHASESATEPVQRLLDSIAKKRKYTRHASYIANSPLETLPSFIGGPRLTHPNNCSVASALVPPLREERGSYRAAIFSDSDWIPNGFNQRIPPVSVKGRGKLAPFDHRRSFPSSPMFPGSKRNTQISDVPAHRLAGQYSSLHDGLCLSAHGFSETTIRFLAPNTELGWESENLDVVIVPIESRQTSVSTSPRTASVEPHIDSHVLMNDDKESYFTKWENPQILIDHNGLWPAKDDNDFKAGSFTLKGWFPSAAYFLKQLLPANINELVAATSKHRASNPGKYPSTQGETLLREIAAVEIWEQGKAKDLLQMGTVAPDFGFLHHSLNVLECVNLESRKIQWLDCNNFTSHTFPYLEFDEYDDVQQHEEVALVEQRNGQPLDMGAYESHPKFSNALHMMASRRLTALPADFDGLQYSLTDHPDLKVEVAVGHQHGVRRRSTKAMSSNTEMRLIVAVVIIRTLTGGLDKQIDWVLVSKLFPEFPMNAVSKQWQSLYLQHRQTIETFGNDFQEFFLEAYETEEVDPIDYDHLVAYDWDVLVDLVIERVHINFSKTSMHRLPDSRAAFNQMFAVKDAGQSKAWRDDYFSSQPPVYRRLEESASEHNTISISQVAPEKLDIDSFVVAKSWARANTLTPSESYNPERAAAKLATMDKGIVAAATSALLESKVLMHKNRGRPTPNRGVEITDFFTAALRKHLDATHLTQATVFKAHLDVQLRAGAVVMVEWTANDGEILAITNLQAHGRIQLEPKGVPMNKFGLTGGGYQTKRMDKAVLRFDMQILPTSSYIFDTDLPILSAVTPDFLPPRGTAGAIPVWLDIGENLIPAMWKKLTCVILATIAMRPGVVIKELVRIFNPALEEWEMRIFIEWGVRVGALTVMREGHEGWNVSEWWWVIGGRAA